MIHILKRCSREIENLPEELRGDLADALARLDAGLLLAMPLSRPMPSFGKRVHELRLKDRAGIYRVFYLIRPGRDIVLVHATKKKTQITLFHAAALVKKRIKEYQL